MQLLTVQLVLSSLSFLYNSTSFVSLRGSEEAYDTALDANTELVKAMSRDHKIAELLGESQWNTLVEVSSLLNGNGSALGLPLFKVLEETLKMPNVESKAMDHPEYKDALIASKALALSIAENMHHPNINIEDWKTLLTVIRTEKTIFDEPVNGTEGITEESTEPPETKFREGCVDTEAIRIFLRGMVPTTVDAARRSLQVGWYLKLPFLVNISVQMVEDDLTVSNCIELYQLAIKTEMRDLKRKAEEYIILEFEEISRNDPMFPALKIGEIFSILMSEKLKVSSEEVVFKAVVRWVQTDLEWRKQFIPTLMKTVRMNLCSLSLLEMMSKHHLLLELEEVQYSIHCAMDLQVKKAPELTDLVKKEQRQVNEILFVVGGEGTGQTNVTVEVYSPYKQRWLFHERINNATRAWTKAVALGKFIYMFFGKNIFSSFDLVKKEWTSLKPWLTARTYFAVVELDNEIYTLGGYTTAVVGVCEKYNPKTNTWTKLPNLIAPVYLTGAAVYQGKVFVAGGHDGSKFINVMQIFDPETQKWTFSTPMNLARGYFSLLSENGYLWAFGGHGVAGGLKEVEKYDHRSKTWTSVSPMPTPRYYHEVAYLSGDFHVMGGHNTSAYSTAVDIYNPRTNVWRKGHDLNFPRYQFGTCVVSRLPNAADYVIQDLKS